ncbi:MAG: hypothetical protein ACREVO_12580 [Steroidobacteraceae bacterium]
MPAAPGTGQLVDKRRNEKLNYRRQIIEAERAGNTEALSALRAIGPPPFADRDGLKILRQWADVLAEGDGDPAEPRPTPIAADYQRDEVPALMRGAEFSRREFYAPAIRRHPSSSRSSTSLRSRCHTQEFVRFEGCHHFVVMNRPRDILRELLTRVLPRI